MSLITRCPFCGTHFKVSPAQINLSEGWVRCGKCTDVFNATEHFVEPPAFNAATTAEQQKHPSQNTPFGHSAHSPIEENPSQIQSTNRSSFSSDKEEPQNPSNSSIHLQASPSDHALDDNQAAPDRTFSEKEAFASEQALSSPIVHAHAQASDTAAPRSAKSIDEDNGIDPAFLEDLLLVSQSARPALDEKPASEQHDSDPLDSEAFLTQERPAPHPEELQFVKKAHQRQFWRRKMVRATLGLIALACIFSLALQIAIWQRNAIAAVHPTAKTWMSRLCAYANCTVSGRQSIEDLRIDSSSFQRISPQHYELSWGIANTSKMWIQTPNLELELLDRNNNIVSKLNLMPQQLGLATELPPQSLQQSSQGIQTEPGTPEIEGYKLRIVYSATNPLPASAQSRE